jgi:hypothetical protein
MLSFFNLLDEDYSSEADPGYSGPGYSGIVHSVYDTESNDDKEYNQTEYLTIYDNYTNTGG